MNIEKMREEFEAAFMRELDVDLSGNRHIDGQGLECYQFDGSDSDERSKLASIAFMFWQASRAAIEIDLPKLSGLNSSFVADGIQVTREHNRYNAGVDDCRKAIKAADLKVKP